MYSCANWAGERVLVLSGKHKKAVGTIVRVIKKRRTCCAIVCFEHMLRAKLSVGYAAVSLDKLKRLCF